MAIFISRQIIVVATINIVPLIIKPTITLGTISVQMTVAAIKLHKQAEINKSLFIFFSFLPFLEQYLGWF